MLHVSCANAKNLVLVKHFVGGEYIKYQLSLYEFFSITAFIQFP